MALLGQALVACMHVSLHPFIPSIIQLSIYALCVSFAVSKSPSAASGFTNGEIHDVDDGNVVMTTPIMAMP